MRNSTKIVVSLIGLFLASTAMAEEWGNLSATFVFGGDAPTAAALTATKDTEVCGKEKLFDESVVVNPDNKGVANVVGYLYLKRGAEAPIHESYAETADAEVPLDNLACRFDPHICAIRTSQTLLIGNKDPVGHNTKIDTAKNPAINDIIPADGSTTKKFEVEERLPVRVSCSIHPWMNGWLLVKENPYFAVTDADGKLEIKNLPAGTWKFQFWHEVPGYITEVNKGGSAEKWKKGRIEIEIKPGDNDLGQIEIPASVFE